MQMKWFSDSTELMMGAHLKVLAKHAGHWSQIRVTSILQYIRFLSGQLLPPLTEILCHFDSSPWAEMVFIDEHAVDGLRDIFGLKKTDGTNAQQTQTTAAIVLGLFVSDNIRSEVPTNYGVVCRTLTVPLSR